MTERASRVLAIDLGTVRAGLAISDPLRLTAQPAGHLKRVGIARDLAALRAIVDEREIATVVVGYPLLMSGEAGAAAKEIESFVARLAGVVACPVVLWDERLTTVQAQRALLEGDVSRRKRRQVVDAAAATVLLQSWLDAQTAGSSST